MNSRSWLHHNASRSLILAGVISIPMGLLTLFYPPAVDITVWGYPFGSDTVIFVSIVLIISHLLKAYGFIGLSRLDGAGRLTQWTMLAASLGFVIVAICEGLTAVLAGMPANSPTAVNLNNGYGAGSMLLAVASVIGGSVIIRRRLLPGVGRWSVLLSGAFMIFVVTPALFTGRGPLAYLTLTVWSLFYIWIGQTLARAEKS